MKGVIAVILIHLSVSKCVSLSFQYILNRLFRNKCTSGSGCFEDVSRLEGTLVYHTDVYDRRGFS